jgi:vacuolar-type H+-ATPase subunit I/STV1
MEPPEPNEMQQLEALAFQFAQKSHALEEELDQMRKAEGEHLNEILRLRDVVVQLEQARMPTPPSGAGTAGSPDNTAKLDQLQAENVSLVQERNRLLSQVMDVQEIQASLAAITLEKEHLDVQVNAMQQEKTAVEQELEAVKERYEAQIRGLEAAKSGGDSSTTEEHLAHIAQLKQVVANQDARYAKQLAELNVTSQRAEKAEEDLGQARLREGELTARLGNLQSSAANKDDAERKAFQLETMLGWLPSPRGMSCRIQ